MFCLGQRAFIQHLDVSGNLQYSQLPCRVSRKSSGLGFCFLFLGFLFVWFWGFFCNSERLAQAEHHKQPLAVSYKTNAETQLSLFSFGQNLIAASSLTNRQVQTPKWGDSLQLSHSQCRAAYSLR